MKITKPGDKRLAKKRVEKPVKFKCNRCDCEWIAVRGEYTDLTNQHDGEMYNCTCPCCTASTWAYHVLDTEKGSAGG